MPPAKSHSAASPQSQIQSLWERYAADHESIELRNQLVTHYLPLVREIALAIARRLPGRVILAELVSAGILGLVDVVQRFDVARGLKFETFAPPRISGAIFDELRNLDHVSRTHRFRNRDLEAARETAERRLGRRPVDEELAGELGLAPEEFAKFVMRARVPVLVRMRPPRDGIVEERERGANEPVDSRIDADPEMTSRRRDFLRAVLKGLNRQERLLVILYYYEQLTMRQIGRTLGLSESRVSQLHSAIVLRLRTQFDRSEFPF